MRTEIASLPGCLRVASTPAITIVPNAAAAELAPALLAAAEVSVPLSGAAIEHWWNTSTIEARTGLVWRLARALPHLGGLAATRLANPAWRYEAGIPLALAKFVVAMRLRRRHRAENTLRAWRSDWRQWRTWCKREGLPSFNPSAAQLSHFLNWYAPKHKVATIRRLGATLTAMHVAAGFPDPLADAIAHEVWLEAIKPPKLKIRKKKPGKDGRIVEAPIRAVLDPVTKKPKDKRDWDVDQAEGLRRDVLDEILAKIDTDTLIGARDVALLLTLYDLLGRREEVVALEVADLKPDPKDESATILIRRSKTDQSGEGRQMYLRPATHRAIARWLQIASITDGMLFRSLRGHAVHTMATTSPGLKDSEVSRIIKRRVSAIRTVDGTPKYNVDLFSGHSCRVGAAQDMAEAGMSDVEIMNAGRWGSIAMIARYTAHIRAKKSAMAKLAKAQFDAAMSSGPTG
ncbi:MAG: tyrosine-type recombinase/integrase [Sulfuricaulis sp.]